MKVRRNATSIAAHFECTTNFLQCMHTKHLSNCSSLFAFNFYSINFYVVCAVVVAFCLFVCFLLLSVAILLAPRSSVATHMCVHVHNARLYVCHCVVGVCSLSFFCFIYFFFLVLFCFSLFISLASFIINFILFHRSFWSLILFCRNM